MSELRKLTLPLAGLGSALALIACGSGSSGGTAANAEAAVMANVAAAQANPIAVSPQPGTPDASPGTQISFLGAAGTKVADVSVQGSASGSHSGVLRAYSTGTGESFLPSHPFRAGERVTVHARVVAGPNQGAVSTSFTIAHQYTVSQKEFPNNPGNASQVQHYSSAPSLQPSSVQILSAAKPGAAPGDLFLAPYQGKGMAGPMIADQPATWSGSIRSRRKSRRRTSRSCSTRESRSRLVAGADPRSRLRRGRNHPRQQLLRTDRQDPRRQRLSRGPARDPLTPEGTAWIDMFDPIRMNLSGVHGPRTASCPTR